MTTFRIKLDIQNKIGHLQVKCVGFYAEGCHLRRLHYDCEKVFRNKKIRAACIKKTSCERVQAMAVGFERVGYDSRLWLSEFRSVEAQDARDHRY